MGQTPQPKQQGKQRLRLSRAAWRRISGQIDPLRSIAGYKTRLLYSAASATNSLLAKMQSLAHAEALERAKVPPPIFLLGFWRSGTTLLHELFCCNTHFGFPSTYACMNAAHFLLTEQGFHKRRGKQEAYRPMDNMQYSWTSPQEDEFALFCMGAPSPYEALLVPSLMSDPKVLLDLRQHSLENQVRWKQTLQLFLRELTVQQNKPMALKSPTHGFTFPLLPSLFPGSRFVIIERNPYEVFASNLKLWQTLLDMYSLELASSEQIEKFVLAAYLIHEDAIAEGIHKTAPEDIARVRYEDLIADPLRELKRIYSELKLSGFEDARPLIESYIASVAGHQRNRLVLSPAQKNSVDQLWGALIREKGYGWPENWLTLKAPA
ncbi:MAG TPA: sulfotransferase [Terriglobales bacterium]|nr:sulfotransferase [Terriglobales bacterium]